MMTDGKLDFGGPTSHPAGAGTSDVFWAQTYFRQSFGFFVYGIPEKFLNFSCLSFLTSNEDNNTSFLREGQTACESYSNTVVTPQTVT